MANCSEYLKMSTEEKVKMIGELVHAVQNDAVCFMTARGMINGAKARGVFDNVVFMPPREEEKQTVNY